MDFELDDDQRELQDTVRGIVDKECSPSFVRSVIDDGIDPAGWWATMVELYWPALAIAEDHGGLGMGWMELAILLEELGRATDPSPFVATTTQFTPAIAHCGDAAQQARWLEGVAAGSITGALALGADTVTAEATDGGWRLNGSVRHVVDGDRADEIAVVATVMDENGDGAPAVFVVERTIAGLTAERTPTFDYVAHIADVTLHDVVVAADRRLAAVDVAGGVERTVAEATLGWAIPTVGACQRILDMTVAYVKERHQFGVPIGSFQAVKHKAVDMYVAVERARAVCQYAALVLAEGDPAWRTAVSMAKAAAGDCQQVAIGNGIQLFGGIGFTWENDLQISVRRAKLGEVMFGSAVEHRRRLGQEALAS